MIVADFRETNSRTTLVTYSILLRKESIISLDMKDGEKICEKSLRLLVFLTIFIKL